MATETIDYAIDREIVTTDVGAISDSDKSDSDGSIAGEITPSTSCIDESDIVEAGSGRNSPAAGFTVYAGGKREQKRDGAPPIQWIGDPHPMLCAKLTPDELAAATTAMMNDLLEGKTPIAEDGTPHFILTIGAPGSGKSTITEDFIKGIRTEEMSTALPTNYVLLDFDLMLKYHPRHAQMLNIPDIAGKPTGLGYGYANQCADEILGVASLLFDKILDARYNIAVQAHDQQTLIDAQRRGYACTLLYVAAPLEVAQRRARERALKVGRLMTSTLTTQEKYVSDKWGEYKKTAPWFALWADHFVTVRSHADGLPPKKDYAVYEPIPAGRTRNEAVALLEEAIERAHE